MLIVPADLKEEEQKVEKKMIEDVAGAEGLDKEQNVIDVHKAFEDDKKAIKDGELTDEGKKLYAETVYEHLNKLNSTLYY